MGFNLFSLVFRCSSTWKRSTQCKKVIKRAQYSLKLLRSRKEAMMSHDRQDIASLLKLGQYPKAFDRVEELWQTQSRISAYKEIDFFCQCISENLSCIGDQSDLPSDVTVAVSSLVFAASRCGELPELNILRCMFKDLYGEKFVSANINLQSGNLVSNQIKQELCTSSISEDLKLQLISDIAREYKITVSLTDMGKNVKSRDREDKLHPEEECSDFGQDDQFLDFIVQRTSKDKPDDVLIQNKRKNVLAIPGQDRAQVSENRRKEYASTTSTWFQSFALISPPPGSSSTEKWYININLYEQQQQSSRTSSTSSELEIRESEIVYLDDIKGKTPAQTYPSSTELIRKARGRRSSNYYAQPRRRSSDACIRDAKMVGVRRDLNLGHVHPRLPDYDDLVTKFREIKTGYVAGRITM